MLELHRYPIVLALRELAAGALPEAFAARLETARREAEEEAHTLPLFVCSLVMPGEEAPLHVFEPRYRLMMRRAMLNESRAFGMCAHTQGGFAHVGVRCKIRSMTLLPDGRSFIDCYGERRFRVTSSSSRDGYTVGRVDFIDDADADFLRVVLDGARVSDVAVARVAAGELAVRAVFERRAELAASLSTPELAAADGEARATGLTRRLFAALKARLDAIMDAVEDPASAAELWVSDDQAERDITGAAPPSAEQLAQRAAFIVRGAEAIVALGITRMPAAGEGEDRDAHLWRLASALPIGGAGKLALLASESLTDRAAVIYGVLKSLGDGRETVAVIGQLQRRAAQVGAQCAVV
jgi:Lon protease-like protein